jgi:hypothetical protein
MNPEQLNAFLLQYGQFLVDAIKNQLNQNYQYAPGFKGDAYSNGRNRAYAGLAPKSSLGQGNLSNSVTYTVNNDNEMTISMSDYWKYVEFGVNPDNTRQYLTGRGTGGTSPFLSALQSWATRKGFQDPVGASYAIRRNIWKFGIQPTKFYGTAVDNLTELIADAFQDQADEMIDNFLDNLFEQ